MKVLILNGSPKEKPMADRNCADQITQRWRFHVLR